MEALQILGWIYLGGMIGAIAGITGVALVSAGKYSDLESEIIGLRLQREALKEEILKLSRRGKPAPRKRKYWKKKPPKAAKK